MSKTRVYLKNHEIKSKKVFLVGDNVEGPREVDKNVAIQKAKSEDLDLVCISYKDNTPVCKILDYGKFLYKLKQKEKTRNNTKTDTKEIRLTPNTDQHDLEFKKKHAINFLSKKNNVKVSIFFKGREIKFKDRGEYVLLKFVDELNEYGTPLNTPKLEGKRLTITLKPKK